MTVLLITIALILTNALCVSAEFAIISAPRPTLEHKSNQGDAFARRLLRLLTSPVSQQQFIATSQLGITVASLGLGMFAEHTLSAWLEPRLALGGVERVIAAHTLAAILAITALTYIHILFGEMLPKALSLVHPERMLRAIFFPMRLVHLVFYPLVFVLNSAGTLGLRLLGVRREAAESDQVYTPEELQIIVEESTEGGAIRAESGKLLRELLEFGDRTAGEAMVPRVRVLGVPVGATPADIRAMLAKHHHTRYPIYDGNLDHIVGMLHVKDLLRRLLANEAVTTHDLRPMPVVPESAPLDAVLRTMQRSAAHLAVVIDEHGGTAGVISLEDLFEEVVGEIDEGPSVPSIAARPDGSVLTAGTVRLDELGRHFDLDLGHEDVDSVSGLVLALLGRTPLVGDVVEYRRVRAEVTATSGHGVKQARVSLLPADEAE